jgi:hypothetical protein
MLSTIVFTLALLAILYTVYNMKVLSNTDISMIGIAIVMLVYTYHMHTLRSPVPLEHFAEEPTIGNLLTLEEDTSLVVSNATFYSTVFSKDSYPGDGSQWFNLIKDTQKKCGGDNTAFKFDFPPAFSRPTGIYMGKNRAHGPFCNHLGINLQNSFTIFFTCRHADLGTSNFDTEIELLKLYANSGNNNGIAIYIQRNTLEVDAGSNQVGRLMMKWVDQAETQCLLRPTDSKFTFKNDLLSVFFIVKQMDKVSLMYAQDDGTDTVYEIGSISINPAETSSATFSNKELTLNRFQNWKGHMFQFGVYSNLLSKNEIINIKNHVCSEYRKNTNQDFIDLTDRYKKLEEQLKALKGCPFTDTTLCKSCETITDWTNMSQIISSPPACKESLNKYCMANKTHPMCLCWDQSKSAFNTDSCKMFRSIFSSKNEIIQNIKQDDLNEIMSKHDLVYKKDCPSGCSVNELKQAVECQAPPKENKYVEYDFDKMKVKMPSNTDITTFKVDKVYPEDTVKTGTNDPFQARIINVNQDSTYELRKLGETGASSAAREIVNLYKQDQNLNYNDIIVSGSNYTAQSIIAKPSMGNMTPEQRNEEVKTGFWNRMMNMFMN